MAIDTGTLATALVVVCAVLAGLILLTSMHDRRVPMLATWAFCFALCGAAASGVAMWSQPPDFIILDTTNALRLLAFGLGWQAARQFTGQRWNWILVLAPGGLWLAASVSVFGDDLRLRVLVSAPLVAAYSLAIAAELWRGARRAQIIARTTAILVAFHGVFLLVRFLAAVSSDGPLEAGAISHPLNPVALFEMLVLALVLGFLLVLAAKEQILDQYRRAALLDPLTGVSNRRAFDAEVSRMLARARRNGTATALLLLDLDHFKAVNDRWGHLAGDRALKACTDAITAVLRDGDVLGRLGGEEFAVALSDCRTDQALRLAERIREAIAALAIREGLGDFRLTVSIGVASRRNVESLDQLMMEADAALYRAKAGGRDRVEQASGLADSVAALPASRASLRLRSLKRVTSRTC